MLNMIVACDDDLLIGMDGKLPWSCPEDLKLFKKITMGHVVVMGRKTWESLEGRPLPGRVNIVLSKTQDPAKPSSVIFKKTLPGALLYAQHTHPHRQVFIIGGEQLYKDAMPLVGTIYLSNIRGYYDQGIDMLARRCYFPGIDYNKWEAVGSTEFREFTQFVFKRVELDWVKTTARPAGRFNKFISAKKY